jgi:hypothetical protein
VGGLAFGDKQGLSWSPVSGATSYNLYRGYLRDLSPSFLGTVLEPELPVPFAVDQANPASGHGFFYLATATGEGEGPLGAGRTNSFPWPGFAVAGRWDLPIAWPGVAVHLIVLRDGKVLSWEGQPAPARTWVWDPSTGAFATHFASTNLFCAGHTQLPDGRLLVAGGDSLFTGHGAITTWTFTPGASTPWMRGPDMRNGRYYPTSTTLADGSVLVFSGQGLDGNINQQVEMYVEEPGQAPRVDLLPGASCYLRTYPMMFLLPDGKVFHAGPEPSATALDVGAQLWSPVDESDFGLRINGSAVRVPPGQNRFMISGGRPTNEHDEPSTDTAEVIDLEDLAPAWRTLAPMHFQRLFHNMVLLPDGKVLVVGGGHNDEVATYPPELFDPATESWSVMTAQRTFRLYHSTAVLLPDGRVLSTGSNGNNTAEIYHPGYLFRGPRPVISSAPSSVRYGRAFTVGTPLPEEIGSVVLMRPGATTHAFDQDQRYVPLTFTSTGTSLRVEPPLDPNVAPPGFYMLFILNAEKVPSTAVFVELKP